MPSPGGGDAVDPHAMIEREVRVPLPSDFEHDPVEDKILTEAF